MSNLQILICKECKFDTIAPIQIKIMELVAVAIQNGNIKIVPDVLVTGGGTDGDGLMGQLTRLLPGVDLSGLVKKSVPAQPEVKA